MNSDEVFEVTVTKPSKFFESVFSVLDNDTCQVQPRLPPNKNVIQNLVHTFTKYLYGSTRQNMGRGEQASLL